MTAPESPTDVMAEALHDVYCERGHGVMLAECPAAPQFGTEAKAVLAWLRVCGWKLVAE